MVIVEDLRCLEEADAMFLLVLASLFGIPFEYQHRASNSNLTFPVTGARRPTLAEHGRRARVRVDWAVRAHRYLTSSSLTPRPARMLARACSTRCRNRGSFSSR